MVEPPDPLGGGGLPIVQTPTRPGPPDRLGLVKPDDRLGEGVVVALPPASASRSV